MNHDMTWQAVNLHIEGMYANLGRRWDCNPAWDILAVLNSPGEELSFTARNSDGEEITKTKQIYRNRHIDKRFSVPYKLADKNSPRASTPTIGDSAREWEILIEHRDRYLQNAGLSLDSPDYDIAKSLADSFKCDSYFKDKPMCETYSQGPRELIHPIDGLLFKSFCMGCATAFAALAQSCGLPTRNLGVGGHWVAEVLIDGKWRFVENTGRHDNNQGLDALFSSSHMEMTTAPVADHGGKTDVGDYQMALFKRPNPQYHNFCQGSWLDPATLRFAADCANALYPDEEIVIRAMKGNRLPITLKAGGFYHAGLHGDYWRQICEARKAALPNPMYPFNPKENFRDFVYYPLKPGDVIRHSFWLDDDLSDLDCIELTIPFGASTDSDFSSAIGGQIELTCGDLHGTLSELGAWPLDDPQNGLPLKAAIKIPTRHLRDGEANWIYLQNSSNSTYHMPFIPNAMEPYIAPISQGHLPSTSGEEKTA